MAEVEFWHHSNWRSLDPDRVLHEVASTVELAKLGYTVDRLKPLRVELEDKYWHYWVPVIKAVS